MPRKRVRQGPPAPLPEPRQPRAGWQNRIVGHGTEHAAQLLANPNNWRIHPKAQQDQLKGVLAEIGWVQSVIVNQRTGFVVDGHARVALAISKSEDELVPVAYVDLSPEEEAAVLATFDPLSAMAVKDEAAFESLKGSMADAYQKLLASACTAETLLSVASERAGSVNQKMIRCPHCGAEFQEAA